jgi:hypothetical protein
MKQGWYYGLSLLLLPGCTQPMDELVYADSVFKTASARPFTGIGRFYFASGTVSDQIHFQDGIPNGTWVSYGYQGEVIYQGEFTPLPLPPRSPIRRAACALPDLKRVTLRKSMDGVHTSYDVLLVSPDSSRTAQHRAQAIAEWRSYVVPAAVAQLPTAIDTVLILQKEF